MKRLFSEISLKAALFAFSVVVTIVAVGLVAFLTYYQGRQAVNDVALQLRNGISQEIRQHVEEYLHLPRMINQINAQALVRNVMMSTDQEALAGRFAEQVELFPSISSISFGNTKGGLANSGRESRGDARYVIVTDEFRAGPFRKFALNPEGGLGAEMTVMPAFDARNRPWFTQAVARGVPGWSDVYILFTGHDMSLASSHPAYDAQGDILGVLAVEVFLSHLSQFLQARNISANGQAFIFEQSGLLVASSTDESLIVGDKGEIRRLSGRESQNPVIRRTLQLLLDGFGGLDHIRGEHQLDFILDGQKILLQVSSLQMQHGTDWLIAVTVPEADFMSRIIATNRVVLFLMALFTGLAILCGLVLSHRIVRPIHLLDGAAEKVAQGSEPVIIQEESSFAEVRGLTRSFNHMAKKLSGAIQNLQQELHERKQAEDERDKVKAQLLQAQKMESVGLLAGGVAHDFNNLLQAMGGNIQLLAAGKAEDHPDGERLRSVTKSIDRAAQLVRQLLLFSRKVETKLQHVDLNKEVREAVAMLERTIPRMVDIELQLSEDLWSLNADPLQIEQLLLNLGSNAADAMPKGGLLTIATANVLLDQDFISRHAGVSTGKHVLLTFSDTGCGMDKAIQAHIYDPFFTTKEVGRGTGLGLASVYGIVKAHGGYIQCSSTQGRGTTFKIYWPARPEQSESFPVLAPGDVADPGGHETILVVDDEESILELMVEVLESAGYKVLVAANGEEALAVYAARGNVVQMVILDLNMPGMGGHECLRELLKLDPNVRVLIASGYSAKGQRDEVVRAGAAGFISKPHSLKELLTTVRDLLDSNHRG